ncbi:hypothetical protein GK047_13660 [Paenibacillus sp. SYP-B3998]|uniref:Endonuclease/exonuclease/phosphatase domain-containing protein n=1 Tax=Paenibacillus sp. SYP-B3998 TaxID=2678564 RepID=A0A6G3ZXW2_9BACL|nr:hypothetical protein [Paenibacillus sp. SYP-B3998]NEW07053.1 hypothetical protein [Paenibacillus sp. SYP-B3998]
MRWLSLSRIGGLLVLLLVTTLMSTCATVSVASPNAQITTIQAWNSMVTPASFTIMTLNIHHGEGLDGQVNLNRIAELLKKEHTDIIALQKLAWYSGALCTGWRF